MRKFRINLGDGGIKGFFVRHGEKVVLLIAVIMVGVLFAAGYQVESIKEDKTPASLLARVDSASRHIDKDTWDILKEVRTPPNDYPERVEKNLAATDVLLYPMPMPLNPIDIRRPEKRKDPDLYKPIKLEAKGMYGPIAMLPKTGDVDRLLTLPAATVKQSATGVATTRPRPNPPPRRGGGEGGIPGLIPGYEGQPGGEGGLMPGMVEGQPRTLSPDQRADVTGDYQTQGEVIAKGVYVVSLTAVVPFELQVQEYESKLKESRSYEPERDSPHYVFFYVERAEVSADPNATLEWTRIAHYYDVLKIVKTWAGSPPPYADPATIDPVLTMPVPPMLMKKLEDFALHSEIRAASIDNNPTGEGNSSEGPARGGDTPADVPLASGPDFPGGQGNESEGGRMPFQPRGQGRPPGNYGESGRGAYGPEGSTLLDPNSIPKYKLFRFFDTTAQWGKSYRYRIQLLLEDPNRPKEPKMDPSPITLSDEVLARVKQLNVAEPMARTTTWFRMTEWSDPSDVISVPRLPLKMLAGVAKPAPETQLPQAGTQYKFQKSGSEPSATVLSVLWDKNLAIEVTGELEVNRASVLNFTKSTDVLHPVTLDLKTIDNYPFTTDATVVDIRGGDSLPGGDRKNPLLAPGEVLILDRYGNLQAHNELDEVADYRKSLFIWEAPTGPAMDMPGNFGQEGPNIFGEGRGGPLRGGAGNVRGRE
jgi:hypothetical protein